MSLPYRLRLPGPTTVPERVRLALASPMVNHRGEEFAAVYREVEERLQRVMGTANRALVFAASGTGMMEASLANTTVPGDRVLVICNGQFADRFATIAASLGLDVDRLEVTWGHAVNPDVLRDRLRGLHTGLWSPSTMRARLARSPILRPLALWCAKRRLC